MIIAIQHLPEELDKSINAYSREAVLLSKELQKKIDNREIFLFDGANVLGVVVSCNKEFITVKLAENVKIDEHKCYVLPVAEMDAMRINNKTEIFYDEDVECFTLISLN